MANPCSIDFHIPPTLTIDAIKSVPPHKTQVREALDEIVDEYNKKISELTRLTAELPIRLLNIEGQEVNGNSSALRMHQTGPSSQISDNFLPGNETIPLAPDLLAGDKSIPRAPESDDSLVDSLPKKDISCAILESVNPKHMMASKRSLATEAELEEAVLSVALQKHYHQPHPLVSKFCPCAKKHIFASGTLDLIVAGLIVASALLMIVEGEYVGYQNRLALGMADVGKWQNADEDLLVSEHTFNAIFILEMVYRFYKLRAAMFHDHSNVLDMFLVGGSSLELYILRPIGTRGSIFGVLRYVRFLRAFRLIRVLRLFAGLRILVKTIMSSLSALITSMVILLMIMIMGGLVLSDLLKEFIEDERNNMIHRKWAYRYYGSSMRAIYTLFEVTLAGCWPTYFRPLLEDISKWYVIFIVPYISFVVFAIIRIITALFLKDTLQAANSDQEMMIQDKLKNKEVYIKKLESVFRAVDTSNDGKLSREEFSKIVANTHVKAWLQILEIEVYDAQSLFRLLDDGDGEITYDEFLQGILRLKGQARSMDIVSIMRSIEKTLETVKCVGDQMHQVHNRLFPNETVNTPQTSASSTKVKKTACEPAYEPVGDSIALVHLSSICSSHP